MGENQDDSAKEPGNFLSLLRLLGSPVISLGLKSHHIGRFGAAMLAAVRERAGER